MNSSKVFYPIFIILFIVIVVVALVMPNNLEKSKIKSTTNNTSSQNTPLPTSSAQVTNIAASNNIIVTSPTSNQKVTTSFKLTGSARVFENVFQFRIKNKRTGKIYAQAPSMTEGNSMGEFGKFDFEINFTKNSPDLKDGDPLILEVYQASPKDGSDMDKVTISLTYQKEQ